MSATIDTKEILSRDADEGVACGPREVMLDRDEVAALCAAYDQLSEATEDISRLNDHIDIAKMDLEDSEARAADLLAANADFGVENARLNDLVDKQTEQLAHFARLAAERALALRKAVTVVREARGWIMPNNLDPDHHHYDPRAVAFAARCDAALAAFADAGIVDGVDL